MPSTLNYLGKAPPLQQHETFLVGSHTTGQTIVFIFTDTQNNATETETVTFPATVTTDAEAAAYALSVLKASNKAIFDSVTFSVTDSTTLNVKGTPGVPYSLATTGTTATITHTTINANSGPNDWTCPGNYAENAAPGAGDSVILWGDASPLYNTYQGSVTYGKFETADDWRGKSTKITATWTAVRQRGKGRLIMDLLASNVAVIVDDTADVDNGALASVFYGTNLASLYVTRGSWGLAPYAGVASTCPLITNLNGRGIVGSGVTLATVNQEGAQGEILISCAVSTKINSVLGKVKTDGSGVIAAWDQYGALCIPNSSGNITAMALKGPGMVDMNQSRVARTIVTLTGAGELVYDSNVVSITNNNTVRRDFIKDTALSPAGPEA